MKPLQSLLLILGSGGLAFAADGLAVTYNFWQPPTGKPQLIDRIEPTIDLTSATIASGYPTTQWDAAWTGSLIAPVTGEYTITLTCDDSARLFLKDRWLITKFALRGGSSVGTASAVISLQQGEQAPLLFRLFQNGGTAKAKLEWVKPGESVAELVPTGNLRTNGWVRLEAPSESYENPISLLAWKRPGTTAALTTGVNGTNALSTKFAGSTTEVAEIPLLRSAPVKVSLITGGESVQTSIAWKIIDLAKPPAQVEIRPGSKLLVKPNASGTVYLNSGYDSFKINPAPDVKGLFEVTIPKAGTWSLGDGRANLVTVLAIALDIPLDLAEATALIQYDTPTIYTIGTVPSDAYSLISAGSFDHLFFVSEKVVGKNLEVTASIGTTTRSQIGFVRIKSTGSIIALPKALAYYTGTSDALVTSTDSDGTVHSISKYYVDPFLPNLQFDFKMRAHKATFLGGAKSFTVKTDGSPTSLGTPGFQSEKVNGKLVGVVSFDVIFPPGEEKWCFTAGGTQIGK